MKNKYLEHTCKNCKTINKVYMFATKIKKCSQCAEKLYTTTGGKIKLIK